MGDVDTKNVDDVSKHGGEDNVKDTVVDTACGIGRFKPRALQRFATVSWFTGLYSIAALMTSTIMVYVNSQITTLERQFGFSSKQTGLIMAANDIGYLVCVLFVSHAAKMVHIPRALGWATIVFGVSGLVCSLPHFIYGSIFLDEVSSGNATSFPVKEAADLRMNESMFGQLCSLANRSQVMCENKAGDNRDNTNTTARNAAVSSLAIIVVGMMLQGFGKAPRASFTIIYIDDNTRRVKSGFYIGIMIALSIMGPAVAFAMGGVFSRMYVTLEETNLNPKHPKWIGAWWLGFLVFGGISVLVSVPIFCFPAKLPPKGDNDEKKGDTKRKPIFKGGNIHTDAEKAKHTLIKKDPEAPNKHDGNNNGNDRGTVGKTAPLLEKILRQGKLFLASLFRILTNPIYVLMVTSTCCIIFMVGGTSAYSPKYLERVFDLPAYKANYIMAGKTLLSSCVGTFVGGYLTKYYKMTAKKALYFIVVMSFISTMLSLTSMFAYCDQPVTYNWPGETDPSLQTCQGNCHCESDRYFPICGGDGKTYYSPCMAGCLNYTTGTYDNCSCIEGGQATSGICPYGCDHVFFFTIVSALRSLFGTLCIIPKVTVLIRTVEERDKALALGVSSFMASMLGWLLGPVVFGIIIDGICSLWDRKCGVIGRCLLYDNDLFRWRLNGYGSMGVGGAFLFQLLALAYAMKTGCLDDIGLEGRGNEVKVEDDDDGVKGGGDEAVKGGTKRGIIEDGRKETGNGRVKVEDEVQEEEGRGDAGKRASRGLEDLLKPEGEKNEVKGEGNEVSG